MGAESKEKVDGILVGGKVTGKNYWPPKEGQTDGRYQVSLAYMGGTSRITVSALQYDKLEKGTHTILRVNQNSKSPIYNDSIEM